MKAILQIVWIRDLNEDPIWMLEGLLDYYKQGRSRPRSKPQAKSTYPRIAAEDDEDDDRSALSGFIGIDS
jgi:hypothetical protein